jgi:ankyrin repeat protein
MRTFQQQYQPRQSTYNPPYTTKKAPYPNKTINDVVKKEFLGTIITANLGDIKKYLDLNTLPINSIKDESGKSILHLILEVDDNKLSENEKLEICTYLVSKGANFHAIDKNGNTPIHIATQRQYSSILKLFIDSKCNINVVNFYGQNALHLAIQPIVKFCPRYKSIDLIPSSDVKTRDINDISIGLMQHLRDFFKVNDLPNIIDKTKTPNAINDNANFPLLYPLLAIKNLISKSDVYLKNKNKDFLKNKNSEIFKNIKNELSKPNYTDKDKQLKIKELLTLNVKTIVNELNEYYKNAKENIKFDNLKAFGEDNLMYYATDNTSTVFSNRNKNLSAYFEEAFNDADGKYNVLMGILNDELKSLMQNITKLEKDTIQMDDFNAYYGNDFTFGYHEQLTDETRGKFMEKYGMKIETTKGKSAFDIFFGQKNINDKIVIKNKLKLMETVNVNGVNVYKQIDTNGLLIGCDKNKIIDEITLKINGVRQMTSNLNEIEFTKVDNDNIKVTIRLGADVKTITLVKQPDNLTFVDKDDNYYDGVAGTIFNKITRMNIGANAGLLRIQLLDKQEIKNKVIEKLYGINDHMKEIAKESANILSYIPLSDDKTFNDIINDFINPGEMARKIINYLVKECTKIKEDNFIKTNGNIPQIINFNQMYIFLEQIKNNGVFTYDVLNKLLLFNQFRLLNGFGFMFNVINELMAQFIFPGVFNYVPPASVISKGQNIIGYLNNLHNWLFTPNGAITKINNILGHDVINFNNPNGVYQNVAQINAINLGNKMSEFKTYINQNQYKLSSLNDLLKYSNEFNKKIQDLTQKINQYISLEHPKELVDQIIKLIDEIDENRYRYSELLTKLEIIKSLLNQGGVQNQNFIGVMNKLYVAYTDKEEKKLDIINRNNGNITGAINNITQNPNDHFTPIINELVYPNPIVDYTKIGPSLKCFKDNLDDLNNIQLILKTNNLYEDYYDILKSILTVALDQGKNKDNIRDELIKIYQNKIVFTDLSNNSKKKFIKYTSTSVLSSFFKNYKKGGLIDEIIKLILPLFNFDRFVSNKYDYYTMYNLLHCLNFSIVEYVSYLLFILKNEKNNLTNLRKYKDSFEGNCTYGIGYEDIEQRIELFNVDDLELNMKKINVSINEIISILNFHQNLVISNSIINKLYTGGNKYFDKENYRIKYKNIIENKFGKKNYNIQGIFNQNMQQLPTIDWENAKNINPEFFKQAYPTVNDMIFYTDVTGKSIDNGNFIVLLTDPPITGTDTEYLTTQKNGLLLYTPKYNDIKNIVSYKFNVKLNDTDPTSAIGFQSLANEKTNAPIVLGTSKRYDKTPYDKGIGIIGVEDITKPNLKIDLLDFTLNDVPFDLTNSYFSVLTNKIIQPNIELITNLKRIFIAMVLDTRKLPIYTYSPKPINDIPGPIITNPLPDKNVSTVYGYRKDDGTQNEPKTLFDFVKSKVILQLKDLNSDSPQIKIVTNHLIAEGIDTILSKNIENYYNAIAYNIQQQILNVGSQLPLGLSDFNLPTTVEKPFKIDFADTNEKLFEIMSGKNYYSAEYDEYPLVDLDMVLMEMSKDEIEIDTFLSTMPVGKNKENMLTVYFKPEYNKTDLSILQKDTLQCIMNNPKIIDELINSNIHLNHQDIWGKTPIHYAIEIKDVNMVKKLLEVSNLKIRNLQNSNSLNFSLENEKFHQKLLIDGPKLEYSKKYELTMDNIFMTNDELRRNMPKHIKLINYLPILLLNNVWYKMINPTDKNTLFELFCKYQNIPNSEKNKYEVNGLDNFMFSHTELNNDFIEKLKNFKDDRGFNFNGILSKFNTIIDKYDKLLLGLDDSNDIKKIKDKKQKYELKITEFKDKIEKNNITKYNNLDDLIGLTTHNTVFDQFDNLQDGLTRPELTHYIFAELMETYVNNNPLSRGENIHLYLSTIYNDIINGKNIIKSLEDLKKIDKILEKICNYLDQRYMENTAVENNIVLDNIVNSITYSSLITLQNSYLLEIKKVLTKHIITNYGLEQLDDKCKNILKDLMDGILNFKISNKDGKTNLTMEYVKLMLGVKNVSGYENVEYNKLDNYMNDIKSYFISNKYVPILDQSTFIKNLDTISNYYKTLYGKLIDHQINLTLNYIKYIVNQSKGLKILILILEKY